jgi:2-keto-3-deoxy-L-rhamnonate aldolase RhmA
MEYLDERVRAGDVLLGVGCNLGSALTVEIAHRAGFDWIWIDLEHGAGGFETLVRQAQAAGDTPAVVRIPDNQPWMYKRVLDAGAAGVMVPYVNTPEDAQRVVAAMSYLPAGIRGVAMFNRACSFGDGFDEYFSCANERLISVVQIESPEAVGNAGAIAATPGVDVLFIGPLDLSANLGIPRKFEETAFLQAVEVVAKEAAAQGKASGILLPNLGWLERARAMGMTFLVVGSEGGMVAKGMRSALEQARDQVG